MAYNKDTDYQEKINEAVSAGDYKSAAEFEKSRNEKIEKENLPQEKTNKYSGWLDTTDYSDLIRKKILSGESKKSVSDSLKKRIEKASGTEGLNKYAYDDVYDMAIKYIMGNGNSSYHYAEPKYKDMYSGKIETAYEKLLNMKDFEYDLYNDDLYKYYKEMYNREGKRAVQDLLGELSMNTGGIASSYAASAAGQMLDRYNEKLTDKIPELYNAAYERYRDTVEDEFNKLDFFAQMYDKGYENYFNKLNQYNKEREFEHQTYMDSFDNELELKKFESEEEKILRELLLKEKQTDYENSRKEENDKIETALEKWEKLGYLDSESAEVLGLPAGLHTADYDYKQAQKYKIYNR